MELRRYIRGRRWIGMYVMALAPVALFLMRNAALRANLITPQFQLSEDYARFYQFFILRFGVFFCSAVIFSQMLRGEVLEKTLHFYLLAPTRRLVIVIGKFLAGVVTSAALFGGCTAATFILFYLPSPSFNEFFLNGNGVSHLSGYMLVTILACIGYGAIFLLAGLVFKNPGIPAVFLLGWESLSFIFPEKVQYFSMVYHFQSLLPVRLDRGVFAVVVEPLSPIVSVPVIVIVAVVFLTVSGWLLGRTQVTYSAD